PSSRLRSEVGSRGRILRLLRVRAQRVDRALVALRPRLTNAPAVQHETPCRLHPVLAREDRAQVHLRRVLLLGPASDLETEPVRHAVDVAVDGDRGDAEGVPKDDRCRLATDTVEA